MKALIKCHEADVRKDFKSEDRVMKIQDVKKLNKNSGILELRLVASPGQYRFISGFEECSQCIVVGQNCVHIFNNLINPISLPA